MSTQEERKRFYLAAVDQIFKQAKAEGLLFELAVALRTETPEGDPRLQGWYISSDSEEHQGQLLSALQLAATNRVREFYGMKPFDPSKPEEHGCWLDIDEHQPEAGQQVLVACYPKDLRPFVWMAWYFPGNEGSPWECQDHLPYNGVLYWMPMPEAPPRLKKDPVDGLMSEAAKVEGGDG